MSGLKPRITMRRMVGNNFITLSIALTQSDYYLFLYVKNRLCGQYYNDDDVIKTAVMQMLAQLMADFYEDGVQKLVVRYDMYL